MATYTISYMHIAAAPAPVPAPALAPAPAPAPAQAPIPAPVNDENTPIATAGQAPAGQAVAAAPILLMPNANPAPRPALRTMNGVDPLDIIISQTKEPEMPAFPFTTPPSMERAQIVKYDQLVWM